LVRVNGRAVTQGNLETAYLVRGVAAEQRPALRQKLLERLVDEALIASYLEQHKVRPRPELLDAQVDQLIALIRRRGEDPDALLQRLGLDRQQIRSQLALPLTWKTYVREVMTPDQLQAYFEAHRRELDGTQLRARHIVLTVPHDSAAPAWEQATRRLEQLRVEIQSRDRPFADAAREFSQGPSATTGGDVGYFPFRGSMPPAFADAAFRLKPGELSQPVRTNVGVHLIEVTDERPGQLSLEDVRDIVLEQIAAEIWDNQVRRERSQARIAWVDSPGV
jgi:parvulin-like peptidyl-prolyl isomerase